MNSFIQLLDRENELLHIYEEVDPTYEIAEIHRRIVAQKGKALLFHRVKNSAFPVATNLFGSEKRIELAFPTKPEKCIQNIVELLTQQFPPKIDTLWQKKKSLGRLFGLGSRKVWKKGVTECCINPVDLEKLPFLKLWPEDGGHFITLPLVYTQSPDGHSQNLGMYRIQRYDKNRTGLHFQIAKGGGFHLHQALDAGTDLPVTIFVGGPPALILSAISPLPENVPELVFASFLQGKKLKKTYLENHPHPILTECEFALTGYCKPEERHPEGPFGDHFGYYSQKHDFPVFHCTGLYHRKNAIWPATVVGKPIQEDLYIGNYLQKLFSPLFPVLMPQVKELHTFAETGFHPLAAARLKERYEKEALTAAFRILGEGQLSLTKCLFLTDDNIAISNIKVLLEAILSRFCPKTGIIILSNTSNDTLDYTGPKLNLGSKMILIGTGKVRRELPHECMGEEVFAPGCLVLDTGDPQDLVENPKFAKWPLLILVDDAKKTAASSEIFLWTVFTRFEPAQDIYFKQKNLVRNGISFEYPILIDARMKQSYPKEVEPDPQTVHLVERRWNSYFR